jgi:hypothetical protein
LFSLLIQRFKDSKFKIQRFLSASKQAAKIGNNWIGFEKFERNISKYGVWSSFFDLLLVRF